MSAPVSSKQKELPSVATWSFLDELNEGVIIANADGVVLYLNQAARLLLSGTLDISHVDELKRHLAWDEEPDSFSSVPFSTRLHLDNGRVLDAELKPYPGQEMDLIQISVFERMGANGAAALSVISEPVTGLPQVGSQPVPDRQLRQVVDTLQAMGWKRVFLKLSLRTASHAGLITSGFTERDEVLLKQLMLSEEAWDAVFEQAGGEQPADDYCRLLPADRLWRQEVTGFDRQVMKGDGWQANDLICVPLYDSQQQRIGLFGLDQPQHGRRPDSAERRTISLFAQVVANLVENARSAEERLKRNQQLETLLEANRSVSSSLETRAVLEQMGQQLKQFSGARAYTIYEWEQDTDCLLVQGTQVDEGLDLPQLSQGQRIPLDQNALAHRVLTSQEPLYVQQDRTETGNTRQTDLWCRAAQAGSALLMPIVLSEEIYGLIGLYGMESDTDLSLRIGILQAIADQACRALETALIFEDTYEREQFYNALGRVSLAINFTLDQKTVLNLISSESLHIFDVDAAYIWQVDGDQLIGSAAAGLGQSEFVGKSVPLSDGDAFVTRVVHQGEAMFINHISPESRAQFRLPQKEAIQSVLGLPFEQEGKILGVLVLADAGRPDRFRDKDVNQARIFGAQAAIALQNARMFEELRQFNVELDSRVSERTQALNEESNRVKILLRITSELSASLDQDRVLNQALHLVNEVVNATEGVILLINPETDELEFRAMSGPELNPMLHQGVPSGLMRDKGLAGWMIDNKSAVIVHDTQQDSRWIDLPRSRNHRSVLGVPLTTSEEVIGVMMFFHSDTAAFTLQQLDLVEAAAIQVANAINNAGLYLLIRDQAESLGTMLLTEKIEAAKSQSILESIADGVIVADADGQITLANMAASVILGISREQLIGKWVNELLGLYGQAGSSWKTTLDDWAANADFLEPGTYLADQLEIEERVISAHLSPVLAGQQYFGTVSVLRDVTKDVELDRLKSEFVSTVSHELRTPMTSIKGYADLMMMGAVGEMTQEQKRYLEVIKNNADRLHMLVNDLLDISRIETGRTELDKRPIDITQLVREVVDGHLRGRIQHENKMINVYLQLASALPLVNADRARITQVLTNLLDNAFNYTPDGGEVRVRGQLMGDFVGIEISDSGIGIRPENQSKVFDRFFRAEDSFVQGVPGTGLGLSIVQNLIDMHGGRLEVESELGQGSTFRFTLPAVVEESD